MGDFNSLFSDQDNFEPVNMWTILVKTVFSHFWSGLEIHKPKCQTYYFTACECIDHLYMCTIHRQATTIGIGII